MPAAKEPERHCRICGCTDEEACWDTGSPCYWIEPDLCSACVNPLERLEAILNDMDDLMVLARRIAAALPAGHAQIFAWARGHVAELEHTGQICTSPGDDRRRKGVACTGPYRRRGYDGGTSR